MGPDVLAAMAAGAFTAAGTTGTAAVASNVAGAIAASAGTIATGTAVGTMGLMGYSSYAAAAAQNRAIAASVAATRQTAKINMRQVQDQVAVERQKRIDQARQVQSHIRVAAGEAGIGTGGTYQAIMRQVQFDTAKNLKLLGRSAALQMLRIRSGAAADLAELQGRYRNVGLETAAAGIEGISAGLNIATSMKALSQ